MSSLLPANTILRGEVESIDVLATSSCAAAGNGVVPPGGSARSRSQHVADGVHMDEPVEPSCTVEYSRVRP
jgi:hypothetical protein